LQNAVESMQVSDYPFDPKIKETGSKGTPKGLHGTAAGVRLGQGAKNSSFKKKSINPIKSSLSAVNSKSKISAFFTVQRKEHQKKDQTEANQYFLPFFVRPNVRVAPLNPFSSICLSSEISYGQYPHTYCSFKDNRRKALSSYSYLVKKKTICYGIDSALPSRNILKLIQFHTNYRPPYYGTISYRHEKKPSTLARSPFLRDRKITYDHDSDDDWGDDADISDAESISASGCDDQEDDLSSTQSHENSDADESDWLVPDGLGCADELISNKRELSENSISKNPRKKRRHVEKIPTITGSFNNYHPQGKFFFCPTIHHFSVSLFWNHSILHNRNSCDDRPV